MNPNEQLDTRPLTDDERYELMETEADLKDAVLMDDDVDDERWSFNQDEQDFIKTQQYERSTRHDE